MHHYTMCCVEALARWTFDEKCSAADAVACPGSLEHTSEGDIHVAVVLWRKLSAEGARAGVQVSKSFRHKSFRSGCSPNQPSTDDAIELALRADDDDCAFDPFCEVERAAAFVRRGHQAVSASPTELANCSDAGFIASCTLHVFKFGPGYAC